MEKEKEELLNAIKSQVAEAKEGLATAEEVVELKSQLVAFEEKFNAEPDTTEIDGLKSQIEELGLELKAQKENASVKTYGSFKEEVRAKLEENLEGLKAVAKGEKQLTFKAVGTMTMASITGAEADRLPEPMYVPGVTAIPTKMPFYMEFADVQGINSATLVWVDEANEEGDAGWTAEGGVKPLQDNEYVPAVSNAKKVAGVIKVSEEMLEDLDFMASEIDRKLRQKHDLKLEDGLLNGDSGSDPNEVDGVILNAPAYITSTSLSATIIEPNNFDAIVAAICQVVNSSDGAYYPSTVFVNPDDACAMDLAKSTDGVYVLPPFTDATGRNISGVRVVAKTKIPTGYFLIGDFSKSHVRIYKDFEITVGWENDDFRKNLRTIIGESRVHHYVSTNEYSAFVYDQFSVVIADLLKP